METIKLWNSKLLCIYTALLMCLSACSHSQPTYYSAPIRGLEFYPPAPVVQQPDPVASVKTYLVPQNKGLIVIDPGHGGKDLGTFSKEPPKYQEKHLNLTTACMLRNYLQQQGYTVEMTREKDVFITLEKRATFANDKNPKLFVSVHFNSAPNKEAEGIEVFFYKSKEDASRSDKSKKLAQTVLSGILKNTTAKSRGAKHGDLSVIRNTNMPAILVEGGFLTNENEVEKLKDAMYLKKIAWGIAQGIDDYLGQEKIALVANKELKKPSTKK